MYSIQNVLSSCIIIFRPSVFLNVSINIFFFFFCRFLLPFQLFTLILKDVHTHTFRMHEKTIHAYTSKRNELKEVSHKLDNFYSRRWERSLKALTNSDTWKLRYSVKCQKTGYNWKKQASSLKKRLCAQALALIFPAI